MRLTDGNRAGDGDGYGNGNGGGDGEDSTREAKKGYARDASCILGFSVGCMVDMMS